MPRIGYVTSFFPLQFAMMILTEYICGDGHRIHVRTESIDWQSKGFVWQ